MLEFSPELLKRLNEKFNSEVEQYDFVNEAIKKHLENSETKSLNPLNS